MAALRPNSRGELLQINGVGEQKAERFGDDFLNAINAGADRFDQNLQISVQQRKA